MKCPNCGDDLTYEPSSKLLICYSCGSKFRPKSKPKVEKTVAQEKKVIEQQSGTGLSSNNMIEYTKYTCGSCGAELAGTYQGSALGFCPYCGGESILSTRLETNRPQKIIPFTNTKNNCHDMYMQLLDKLPFVPEKLKDPKRIDEIRGIYVPYNIYEVRHTGDIHGEFGISHGNTTDYYDINSETDSLVMIPIDGSSQLDDNIGVRLFPYDSTKEEDFDESYLATNYVELPDVDDRLYTDALKKDAVRQELNAMKCYSDGKSINSKENNDINDQTKIVGKGLTLAPSYFLTYRNSDRVCYVVLPGSGKQSAAENVYAEIPIDAKKYMLAVFILTIILWGVLTFIPFIPTFKHETAMKITVGFISAALNLCYLSCKIQNEKRECLTEKNIGVINMLFKRKILIIPLIACHLFRLYGLMLVIWGITCYRACVKIHKSNKDIRIGLPTALLILMLMVYALAAAASIVFFTDAMVYATLSVAFIPTFVCFLLLVKEFNNSCTRPIPHFSRQGGHNEA